MSDFNCRDIVTLQEVICTFSKIDEILNSVTSKYGEKIGVKAKCKKEDRSLGYCYIDYEDFENFRISYGIGWFFEEGVCVYLDFWANQTEKKDKWTVSRDKIRSIKEEIKGVETFFDDEKKISVGFKRPLVDFLVEENQKEKVIHFLKMCIEKVEDANIKCVKTQNVNRGCC